jgi:hypothetical protein
MKEKRMRERERITNRINFDRAQTMNPEAQSERIVLMRARACERFVATAELNDGLNDIEKVSK